MFNDDVQTSEGVVSSNTAKERYQNATNTIIVKEYKEETEEEKNKKESESVKQESSNEDIEKPTEESSARDWSNIRIDKDTKYVDLGLSVKWADRNFETRHPANLGKLLNWNQIEKKIDTKTGVPTLEQFRELEKKCYWKYTEQYAGENIEGYIIFKAKYFDGHMTYDYSLNDAHIFLPKAEYWTQTPYNNDKYNRIYNYDNRYGNGAGMIYGSKTSVFAVRTIQHK